MTNQELVRKADLAITDLTGGNPAINGGYLTPEQENAFFRKLISVPTIIREARTVFMNSPQREINKVGFGSRILRNAAAAVGSGGTGGNTGGALAQADRSKPDLSKLTLTTKELIAEVRVPYDVFEDNIERQSFNDTLMDLIIERVSLDIEEVVLKGDTTSGDSFLAAFDGVLKKMTSNVVDAQSATVGKDLFRDGLKAMPDQYLRNRAAMRHYISIDNEVTYRDSLADRQTSLGDTTLTGMSPVYAFGVPIMPVALMPEANGFFTDPKNIILGFQRRVQVETDRLISERMRLIVVTLRMALEIEEENATVKYTNIASA